MSYQCKPREYGLVLRCDVRGCTEVFDTGQIKIRLARKWAIGELRWGRLKTAAFGPPRVNDLCPAHAAAALARHAEVVAARKKRADDKAAGKKHVGTPATGWVACERCGAHVLKRIDGGLRAHAPGLGRVTKRGQALCGDEVPPPLEPAQPAQVSP